MNQPKNDLTNKAVLTGVILKTLSCNKLNRKLSGELRVYPFEFNAL